MREWGNVNNFGYRYIEFELSVIFIDLGNFL